MTKTYRNFITAVREQTGAEKPNVRRGFYRDTNSNFDFNLINNNSTVCENEIVSETEIRQTISTKHFTKSLDINLPRVRKMYISDSLHTYTEICRQKFRGKTPFSFIYREVPVQRQSTGVRYAGDYQLTDYIIHDNETTTEIWTKIEN